MSNISVNDHLEGILSDFEALKRSFDIDDVDDIPAFSPSSSVVTSPMSPSSTSLLNKTNESNRSGGVLQSSNHHVSSSPYRSRIGVVGSSPAQSPVVQKSRMVSSLSFNRGTTGKPAIHASTGINRAASFQNKFNPNGFNTSSSGLGSDNDSLHSSSSSLEYQASSSKLSLSSSAYTSPPQSPMGGGVMGEYKHQHQQHHHHVNINTSTSPVPVLKKFSSHGNVFHSGELENPLVIPTEPIGMGHITHGSMPSLDFQMGESGGGGGGVRRMVSPGGSRFGNVGAVQVLPAGWQNNNNNMLPLHQRQPGQNMGPYSPPTHQRSPKPREQAKLNKFPLDLDSLVVGNKQQQQQVVEVAPVAPKPPPRSFLPRSSSPSTSASPSASISSLDSTDLSVVHPHIQNQHQPPSNSSNNNHHNNNNNGESNNNNNKREPMSPPPPPYSPGAMPVPRVSPSPVPLSPAQTPKFNLASQPQVVQLSPVTAAPAVPPFSMSMAAHDDTANEADLEDNQARESVGSILQRIASFSRLEAKVPAPVPVSIQSPSPASQSPVLPPFSNGMKRESPQVPAAPAVLYQEDNRLNDTAQELQLELEPAVRMEEREREVQKEVEVVMTEDNRRGGGGGGVVVEEQQQQQHQEEVMMMKQQLQQEQEQEQEQEQHSSPLAPRENGGGPGVITGKDLFGYVGIEAVLDQMRRKTMKAGFEFNIMVVGQSGLGKSTLVNTLFKSKVSRKSCTPNYEEKISKTVHLQSVSHVIEEKGVKMKLTVIDTPGFGDQINNENCWEPIVSYVNEQYEKYLREELHVTRKRRIPDSRVHCCVYFLPATGHRLRQIDIEFMKRLGKIVSIVPVIAKADTLTMEERQEFKLRIRQDLAAHGIRVYPQREYDEDVEDRILNDKIRENIPFAVVGTDKEHQVNGNKVLGRKTKWGIIEVENVAHCEFANLRDLLIRSHLQDLKDVTHNIHYETYRVRRLNESNANANANGLGLSCLPLSMALGLGMENGSLDKDETESHL